MRKLIVLSLFIAVQACTQPDQRKNNNVSGTLEEKILVIRNPENFNSEVERLDALFETYTEYLLSSSPINATFYG
ncbi:MAG: hypothetical protein RLQ12_03695, partial [Cyclobacteriaceae bacterium]